MCAVAPAHGRLRKTEEGTEEGTGHFTSFILELRTGIVRFCLPAQRQHVGRMRNWTWTKKPV